MQAIGTSPGFDPVEERTAASRLPTLGLQHVLVICAGAIAVPLIVSRALQLSPQDVAFLISAGLFLCGIVSIIQRFGVTQSFGIRLPVMMGVTLAAVGPMVALASSNSGPDGARTIFGTIMAITHFGTPIFDPVMILTMLLVMVVTMVESTGIFPALSDSCGRRMTPKALAAVGLNWFFNGAPHQSDEDIAAAAHAAEAH